MANRIVKGELADPKLLFSLGTIGQIILTCAIVGPLSYVAGKLNWPLQDQALLAIDRALGLDPEPIARYVNDHPWLADVLARGYGLIKLPLLGVPVVLALTARYVRLQLFMLAMSLALAVTIAISAIVPAIGTYWGLQLSAAHFPEISTVVYAGQLRDILALRDDSLHELPAVLPLRHRLVSELPRRVGRALHVGAVAGAWPRRHRGRAQSPDDRSDAGDRRALHHRRRRRHRGRRSVDLGGEVLSAMARPGVANVCRACSVAGLADQPRGMTGGKLRQDFAKARSAVPPATLSIRYSRRRTRFRLCILRTAADALPAYNCTDCKRRKSSSK
ncbi:hypothetical protein ACVW1A_003848 [Bradyrhizobium sp. LB1.3]